MYMADLDPEREENVYVSVSINYFGKCLLSIVVKLVKCLEFKKGLLNLKINQLQTHEN